MKCGCEYMSEMEFQDKVRINKLESKVEKMNSEIIDLRKKNIEQGNLIKVTYNSLMESNQGYLMVLELGKINSNKMIELQKENKEQSLLINMHTDNFKEIKDSLEDNLDIIQSQTKMIENFDERIKKLDKDKDFLVNLK